VRCRETYRSSSSKRRLPRRFFVARSTESSPLSRQNNDPNGFHIRERCRCRLCAGFSALPFLREACSVAPASEDDFSADDFSIVAFVVEVRSAAFFSVDDLPAAAWPAPTWVSAIGLVSGLSL